LAEKHKRPHQEGEGMNRTGKEDVSYVLVTAAYNEERYIEKTIQSVLAQVVPPKTWVIVSDGSTDRTDEIVQQYARSYPFIRFTRREKDHSCNFACKVLALRVGLQSLTLEEPIQFIGHLDADVSLDPSYFRDLLAKFKGDADLGVAGGWYFEKTRGGVWQSRPSNTTRSLPDGIQMFRRECYKDIGELPAIEYGGGEDWYAQIRARMCGWRVRSFPELKVLHLRATGTRGSLLRRCYRNGFMDFAVGSHPLFETAKVARMSTTPPYVLNGLARMLGFVVAHIIAKRRVSPECVAFLRREQLGRLWSFVLSVKRGHLTFDL
jgi:GT2 family glycosyltransferase